MPYRDDGQCIACIQRASVMPKPSLSLGKVMAQLVIFAAVCAAGVFAYMHWMKASTLEGDVSAANIGVADPAAAKAHEALGDGDLPRKSAGELIDKLGPSSREPVPTDDPRLATALTKVQVTLYSNPECQDCISIRKYMEERSIVFQEIDVSKDPQSQKQLMLMTEGTGAIPTTVIDGQVYSGFKFDRFDYFMRVGARAHL